MRKILAGLVLVLSLQVVCAEPRYAVTTTIQASDKKITLQGPPAALSVPVESEEDRPYCTATECHHSPLTRFFPTAYDAAKRVAPNAAIPMFPKSFGHIQTGWKIVTSVSEQHGELLGIRVDATFTAAVPQPRTAFGENTDPIYFDAVRDGKPVHELMVSNSSPSFSETNTTTHFYLFAHPGKNYTIPLKQGSETVNAVVTCTIIDTPALKTVAQH